MKLINPGKLPFNTNKESEIELETENFDDIWEIKSILQKDDIVSGETYRKITIGDKEKEKARSVKKKIYLKIKVEETELQENQLRIKGKVENETDDIPKGSYHSLNIDENCRVKINKSWYKYQLEKIKKIIESPSSNIIACLFDREQGNIFSVKNENFTKIGELKGNVQKKDYNQNSGNFFPELAELLSEKVDLYNPDIVVCASSHFWHTDMKKTLNDYKFAKKTIYVPVSDIDKNGLKEALSRQEVIKNVHNLRIIEDEKIIEELNKKIMQGGNVCYGEKDCNEYSKKGAIEKLILTNNYIKEKRMENTFSNTENLLHEVENNKGEIHIISGDNEPSRKLDGLGGIAAFLRFK
ncbi:MAG: hypothetical protein ACQER9_02820 [Nanobdellota archaeon]